MTTTPRVTSTIGRPGSIAFLAIFGAVAMLLYGAVLFSKAMSRSVVEIALKVATTDQLNAATFLAKELGDNQNATGEESSTPLMIIHSPADVYRETFDNFTVRHGIRAYVVNARSHAPVLEGAPPLPVEAPILVPRALRSVYGDLTLSQAIALRRKLQGTVTTDHGRQLVTLVPIQGTTDLVVIYRPEAPILTAAEELTQRFTGYLLAAFTIVLILFALFMRTITRPLRDLTLAVQEMGSGALDQTVVVPRGSEVSLLAEAFNQMSRELRVKYRELAATTRRLEDSNDRYRQVLVDYERQNTELSILNTLVFEASRTDITDRNLDFLTNAMQRSYGLLVVAIFEYHPRHGWDLLHASDPLFETCNFAEGGLLADLQQLARHKKLHLASARRIGESRGSSYSQSFASVPMCIVPVTVQGALEAAFVLVAPRQRDFSRAALARYTRLTQQLGILFHKDKLLRETQRRREQLEKINSLGAALLSDLDFDSLVPRMLHELSTALNADQALLCLQEDHELRPVMAVDATGEVPPFLHSQERTWNAQVIATGEPLLVGEYPRLELWTPDEEAPILARASRFQSFLALPISQGNAVTGVLVFLAEQPHTFDQDDIQFLITFANQLAAAILNARLFQEISRRDDRRNVQLATAKQFQADRIPMLYEDEGIEALASLLPAEELAGDFFDVFRLSPNITGLVIGDVASKGVAASLLTFSMLSIFRNYATAMRPPAKVMELTNDTVRAQLKGDFWFVTAFYARINHMDMTMTYCKAGHVMPVLYHADTGTCELLDGEGLPLGILDGEEYDGGQVDLAPGDRLVFYTDGVTELKNARNQQFGVERLCEIVAANGHESPARLKEAILEALDAWGPGAGRDDILLATVGIQEKLGIAMEITYEEMEEVIDKIMSEIRSFPVDATTLYAVRLALNETIANAWMHGNQGDATAPIWITYRVTSSYFSLQVRDGGRGFDYENLPDPTVPDNLIRTHGRGIFLMRQLMDDLEFNEAGNEIRVRKYFTFQTVQDAVAALQQANAQVAESEDPAVLRALYGGVE
ncbi:MAG: hypothetical protein GEEBNDBF_01547 [bacterium]|nr:hypothetical protein [bacterium]